jgi:RNA polymerase sigma-70 factor (ECF subfamily)
MTQQDGAGRWSLESQSNYLLLLAQCQMPRQLRSRLDPADAVHQTLVQALPKLGQCRAETEAQFRAWLRVILKNVLAREAGVEPNVVSLCKALDESSGRFERFLAADGSSPSEKMMREEQLVQLAEAIAALPADQQRAIRLHHLDGLSLIDVGHQMTRSKEAVAGLLFRGLKRLRDALGAPH